jgi:hypothetical protein
MIKDVPRDSIDYQAMRSALKRKENINIISELKADFVNTVARHLGRIVSKVTRPHLTSQSEEIIDKELITHYLPTLK